jgi:hypothetical protein
MEKIITASSLKLVPFPECAATCSLIKVLGCGECENVCPYKFDAQGKDKAFTPDEADAYWNELVPYPFKEKSGEDIRGVSSV